jgi:hypothetical protein
MSTILPEPDIILNPPEVPEIPLPKNWADDTLLAILHVKGVPLNLALDQ